jgi:hypothetical protein
MGKKINYNKYRDYAKDLIEMLRRSTERLRFSYNRVAKINLDKATFTDEELETIESLCSRFARTSDMILQKAFRFLDIWELEQPDISVIDRIHNAEKRRLIPDAEEFKYIRELRNDVAHNYALDHSEELFKEIFVYTKVLFSIVERTIKYIQTKVLK